MLCDFKKHDSTTFELTCSPRQFSTDCDKYVLDCYALHSVYHEHMTLARPIFLYQPFWHICKNSTGKSVVDLLDARIKENRYPKNRHGSLLQIEDKKMLSKLNKLYCEKMYPEDPKTSNNQLLRCGIALACIALLVIVICASASLKNNNASGASNTESISTYVTESDT